MSSHRNFVVGPNATPDKYQLLRQVGSGGEAELWQATVSVDGGDETVAVKILRTQHAVDPEQWQQRWGDQVEMLRLLRHPGVVGVHEFFVGPDVHLPGEADPATQRHYLVMNWVEGIAVREWAATSHDRFEATRYLTQLAEVLDWLHSGESTSSGRAVTHGDISPGNVIINPDGQTVLVDFGLFRMTQEVRTSPRLGTEGYCAPEVTHSEYSPASDRYAFGALAYFMLTGLHPPADEEALREALLTQLQPLFDGADADTIGSIAAADPGQRPRAGDWLRALRPHATTAVPQEKPLPPRHPSAAAPSAKPVPAAGSRRRKVLIAATGSLLLVLVLGVAGGVWYGTTNNVTNSTATSSIAQLDMLTVEPSSSQGFAFDETSSDSNTEPDATAEATAGPKPDSKPLEAPCETKPFVTYDALDFDSLDLALSASDNSKDVEVAITAQSTSTKDSTVVDIGPDKDMSASVNLVDAQQLRIEFDGGDSGTCAIDSGWFHTQ